MSAIARGLAFVPETFGTAPPSTRWIDSIAPAGGARERARPSRRARGSRGSASSRLSQILRTPCEDCPRWATPSRSATRRVAPGSPPSAPGSPGSARGWASRRSRSRSASSSRRCRTRRRPGPTRRSAPGTRCSASSRSATRSLRRRDLERALPLGEYVPADDRVMVGTLLGAAGPRPCDRGPDRRQLAGDEHEVEHDSDLVGAPSGPPRRTPAGTSGRTGGAAPCRSARAAPRRRLRPRCARGA